MKIPTKEDLYRRIRAIVRQELQSVGPIQVQATGSSGVAKGIVPAAYTSGNPKIQRAHETSTTLGSKTYKVHAPITNRVGALAAGDNIAYWYDPDGNKAVQGKIVDVGSVIIDADYWMGFRPVAAGNTLLLTANTERNTTSTSYVMVKRFFVTRPGRYRIKCQLSRSGGTTSAQVGIEMPDGTIIAASAAVTETTVTYPTFSADKTADMTVSVGWGQFIVVQLKTTSLQTAYIQNVTVNYADATSALTPLDSVDTD